MTSKGIQKISTSCSINKWTEEGFRQRLGSDTLIGCYTINKDGGGVFTDIRGGEGDLVERHLDKPVIVAYNRKKLEVGAFYSFSWHLENDDICNIVIDGEPEKVDNSEFLSKLFDAKLKLNGINLEMCNNFQKTILNEVTGAQHTYIYELLQNANDYPHDKERVNVKFILTEHYLFFMHSGEFFNLRNVVGLSSINQGEKKKNTKTIGYKGIGFKTVFVNNNYVYLNSGEWSLRFDKEYSEQEFYGECPWTLMPIPTSRDELDQEVCSTLDNNKEMRVQFALRHKKDARENIAQLDKVFSDNQILLFIPNVYRVDVIINGKSTHEVIKDDDKWTVSDYYYDIPQDLREWVKNNINSGDKIPEKFKEIDKVRISFAVARDGNVLRPIENARVYNYLPTELRLGFNFLFNADFVPNGSRSGLHDVTWNDHIMEQCGSMFVDWWISFLENDGEYDMESVFGILPEFDSRDKYAQLFIKGFSKRIQEVPCIPTFKEGKYQLVKLEDVVWDKIKFVACENAVLTDDEFYEFTDITGFLPHSNIRCNENLERLLKQFDCSIKFGNSELWQLCLESDFIDWLRQENNDRDFIGYLLESGYIQNCWNYKIFLTEDGEIDKAENLYYDVDAYINDISFLVSEIMPRLNVKLRNYLSENYSEWDSNRKKFNEFSDTNFVNKIFCEFNEYVKLFKVKKNNVHFVHFLATKNITLPIPDDFPYFIENGSCRCYDQTIYLKNEIGTMFKSHSWVNKEWINFIHEDYFKEDGEKVINFFNNNRHKIHEITDRKCYNKIIANENYIPLIAENIKSIENNVDFYRYLAVIQDEINKLSESMRSQFVVYTTDGKNTVNDAFIRHTIFKKDSDWEEMANVSWMPEKCCLAISDIYYEGLSEQDVIKLENFFSSKQIVQKFSIAGFCTPLRMHWSEVIEQIKAKEISKEFLNFLFINRVEIKRNNSIQVEKFRSIPVLCKDGESLIPLEQLRIYIPSKEALELYNMPWMNHDYLTLLDDYYTDLFDGTERCEFFNNIGIRTFDKLHYLRGHLLNKLDIIKEELKDRDNNISFHHYLAEVHKEIPEKQLEMVKEMPIYISSPVEEKGELCDRSANHYLPSKMITDIISKDLVPVSIMDSIHIDYFQSIDKEYFEKLDNVEFDENCFYEYLYKEADIVIPYLNDPERNIRFWRWVADSGAEKEQKAKISVLPMLGRENDNEQDFIIDDPSDLYISSQYLDEKGLELFIKDNDSNPKFVSPSYIGDGINRDWISLFRTIGVIVDYQDIVFKQILPNLSRYKNTEIIRILAKYREEIVDKLKKDKTIYGYLSRLYLKCKDGAFRMPKDLLVSGRYFDIEKDPFKDIVIGNLVSEDYIDDCKEDNNLHRNVKEFIKAIADNYGCRRETLTQLRNEKLEYFIRHQQEYYNTEAHYKIICELAEIYKGDKDGIGHLLSTIGTIKLYTIDGGITDSKNLYFSTAYNPDCQFMANGITELSFVSEEYVKYGTQNLKDLFAYLGVKENFSSDCLQLLSNESFAIYFWKEYAPQKHYILQNILTDKLLKDVYCIPTSHGVKRPKDLYDYRCDRLKKMVLLLKDGASKLPSIELPKYVGLIGLRDKLYLPDCLAYLQLDNPDYRREVMEWIIGAEADVLERYKENIRNFSRTAHWYSGDKKWRNLSSLVALEWGNNTLKGNFSGNAYVCNLSYMPESRNGYDCLCNIFGIKILKDRDFTKKKVGLCREDDEAIREINKRLVYIAYKNQKDDWEKLYEKYKKKLQSVDIELCEKIEYSYNDNISTEILIYAEDMSKLWYTDSWKGPMFLEILDWITKKFEIKGLDDNFLKKLFLTDFKQFIQKEEAGSLPQEVLDYLDESDRDAIQVDNDANAEHINEENGLNNGYSYELERNNDDLNDSKTLSNNKQLNQNDNQKRGTEQEKQALSTDSELSTEGSERKKRSDYGGTHNRTTRQNLNNTTEESLAIEDTQLEENKPIKERLKEKWESKAQRSVGKPHSSHTSSVTISNINSNIDNESSDDPFFAPSNDNYTTQRDYSNNSKTSQNLKRKKTETQNAAQNASDQLDILELLRQTPMYTFLWFKYLMELQFIDDGKVYRKQAQIDFKDFEVRTNGIVRLLNPSVIVPLWIGDATNLDILLIGKTQQKVQGVIVNISDEGVDILLCDNDEDKFINLHKIRISAESSTNIIDSLTTRFLQLEYEDDYNLNDNLTKDIKFIYGPPGTGKTTRLVEILHKIVTTEDDVKNILVLTPTNKASDIIVEKLVKDEVCYPYLTRFGSTESQYLIKEHAAVLHTREDMNLDDFDKNIVVTTMARYPYDYVQPDDTAICDIDWDYIIIDEASMIELVSITYVLYKAIGSKFIIAGDPKQIQPISQGNIESQNIYQMVGLDSFQDAIKNYKRYPVETLMVQHRSVPTIGNLVSEFAYNGLVRNDEKRDPQKQLVVDGIPTKNINFIGFRIEEFDNMYGLLSIEKSALHLYSAIFTYNMVDYVVKQITSKYPNTEYSIGIVCPYKAQAEAIKQMTDNRSLDRETCKVTSGTVHKFQGDECDIMFIVLNPPVNVSSGSHINTENIINVAISRARDYIFFILPSGQIDGFNVKNRLGKIIENKDRTLQYCSDIETVMFGNRNYIYENTNVSCHLPVNVFYDSHAKYEVRIDETALDIQINEKDE